jgi:hypothetical protein
MVSPRPRPDATAGVRPVRGSPGRPRRRRGVEVVAHRPAGRVGRGRLARPGRPGIGRLRPERRWRRGRRWARRPVEGCIRGVGPSASVLRPPPGSARRCRVLPRGLRPTGRRLGWSQEAVGRGPRRPLGGGDAVGIPTRGCRGTRRGRPTWSSRVRPTRSRRWGWRGRPLGRPSFTFVAAHRLGAEPALGRGRRRPLQARVAAGGRQGPVAGGMAGGWRLPAGSGVLFVTDRRRFRGHRRRLLTPGGCHTRSRSRLVRSCATFGSRSNRNGRSRPGVVPGPPARVARRARIRGLLPDRAGRSLGLRAAAAAMLVRRVDRGLRARPGLDPGLDGRGRSIGAGRGRGRPGRWRSLASRGLRPAASLGRGRDRLAGGGLAVGRGRIGDRAGAIPDGRLWRRLGSVMPGTGRRRGRLRDRRRRRDLTLGRRGVPVGACRRRLALGGRAVGACRRGLGPRLSGVRGRRGCRGGLGGPVGRELAGRRNRGAGFLRTGVRRRVRSGRFGRFCSVWFGTSWPGDGIGRLVHASSLVRPPDGRCAQPIDAGTLLRQAAPTWDGVIPPAAAEG